MSGPIVRKYGFPNFDEIFGKRELEHGVEGKKPLDPLNLDSKEANETEKEKKTAATPASPSETK